MGNPSAGSVSMSREDLLCQLNNSSREDLLFLWNNISKDIRSLLLCNASNQDILCQLFLRLSNDSMKKSEPESIIKMATPENKKYLDKHPYKIYQSGDMWITHFPDESKKAKRVIRRRKTKQEIEELIIDYWKSQDINPTIKDVFTEWNDRRLNLHKISNGTYMRNRQDFDRFFSDFGERTLKDLSASDVEDFLEEQISLHKLTAKRFSSLKTLTKGILLRATKKGYVKFDVNAVLNNLDISDKEFTQSYVDDSKEVFYDDEMDAVLSYCRLNPDVKNLGIALMFATGVRVGEVVALKHSDFDDMVFDIRRSETRYKDYVLGKYVVEVQEHPKTKAGIRTVIVPEKFRWVVQKLKLSNPFGDYIFVNDQGNRINANIIRKRLTKICDKLGIPHKSPHKIRKTYGSILMDNGLDNKLIEKQMGHTNILTTELHYHRDRKRLSDKMQIFNNLPEFMVK